MPASITDCAMAQARERGLSEPSTMGEYEDLGFAIFGGCWRCHASLAAYNAFPTTRGLWACADCVGNDGFPSAKAFFAWVAYQEALEEAEATPCNGCEDFGCTACDIE